MPKYILLKDAAQVWRRSPGATGKPVIDRSEGTAEPVFTTEDLSATDLRDVAKDLDVLAAARAMPTQLIGPEVLDEFRPEDAEPGWNFEPTGLATSSRTGAGQSVAILDTGIDASHPAFAATELATRDFTGRGLRDYRGHGTHCAGIVFGDDIDGQRIGTARGLDRALIGKVVQDTGFGTTEAFFDAMNWIAEREVPIVLFSLDLGAGLHAEELVRADGMPEKLAERQAARTMATTLAMFDMFAEMLGDMRRPLFVVPAGNDSKRQIAPDFEVSSVGFGRSRQTVTVTAVGPGLSALDMASFSNTGANFAAPGVGIASADEGGGLRTQNGTSLAAAHVAGIAALWLEASGGETPGGVAPWLERVLQENASLHALNPELGIHDVGHGLVQAPA